MTIEFDGRVAIVTGAGGGLGKTYALELGRRGARVVVNDLGGNPDGTGGAASPADVAVPASTSLPVVLTSWADWQAQHPDTLVLSENTGHSRPYRPGAAYGDYFAFEDTMFPVWQRSDRLPEKEEVYAVRVDGQAKAYRLATVLAEGVHERNYRKWGRPVIRAQLLDVAGRRKVSKIAPSVVFNTVNQPIFPTDGERLTASFDLAGLGHDTQGSFRR